MFRREPAFITLWRTDRWIKKLLLIASVPFQDSAGTHLSVAASLASWAAAANGKISSLRLESSL